MITRRALDAIAHTLGDELAFLGLGRVDAIHVGCVLIANVEANGDLTPQFSRDRFEAAIAEAWDEFHAESNRAEYGAGTQVEQNGVLFDPDRGEASIEEELA